MTPVTWKSTSAALVALWICVFFGHGLTFLLESIVHYVCEYHCSQPDSLPRICDNSGMCLYQILGHNAVVLKQRHLCIVFNATYHELHVAKFRELREVDNPDSELAEILSVQII